MHIFAVIEPYETNILSPEYVTDYEIADILHRDV